jgi:uridine kinase
MITIPVMENSKKTDENPTERLFSYLSHVILDYKKELPVLAGIDGVDASGKTTLADKLAGHLEKSGRQIIRASIDGFHNPSSVRYRQGRESSDGYYRDSFNHELIIENLLRPLGTSDLKFKEKVFDYRLDKEINIREQKAEKDAILIMDGIFLFRPELLHYWDIKIFLDAGFDVTLHRPIKRAKDRKDPDTEQDIIDLYNRRYIPGQKLYFQEASPQEKADIVIDNNDYNNPFIIRTIC